MSTNLDAFKAKLREVAVKVVPERVSAIQRTLAIKALEGVVLKTPVDRGRLRANWQIGTDGAPSSSLLETDASGGEGTIAREKPKVAAIKPFSVTSLVNNLVYAPIVENGGFVPPDPVDSPEANALRSKLRKAFGRRDDNEGKPKVKGGYSIQAPQGMLAVTFEELVQFAQRAARLPETGGAS